MATVLVVDDDRSVLDVMCQAVAVGGHEVLRAASGHEAVQIGLAHAPDVVVADLNLGDAHFDGVTVFQHLRDVQPHLIGIAISGHVDAYASRWQTAGFANLMSKPFRPKAIQALVDELLAARLVGHSLSGTDAERAPEPAVLGTNFDAMVGQSAVMRVLFDEIRRTAPLDVAVLIQGESGTGKELVARSIHDRSRRAGGPFVAVPCPAVHTELFESELFGHARGAYTGAVDARAGLVEAARGGTLFLDEVGDLAVPVQAKLLRFLQEREFRRVGSVRTQTADVRFIAATNVDLTDLVAAGRFRMDLYWRLAASVLHVPPLRHRGPGDVEALARHCLLRLAAEMNRPCPVISAEALAMLVEHDWPGNVREMQAKLRAALFRCGDSLEPDDLSLKVPLRPPLSALTGLGLGVGNASLPLPSVTSAIVPVIRAKEAATDFKRQQAEAAISAANGDLAEAARRLGVSSRTLHRWRHGKR